VPEVRRTDEKLANLVAAALVGDAATEVYEINVQAQDGVVTLTGVVDFWHEEQLAIKVAAGVSGLGASTVKLISTTIQIVRMMRSRRRSGRATL
jgi:osmotically-inducible protein OsmY